MQPAHRKKIAAFLPKAIYLPAMFTLYLISRNVVASLILDSCKAYAAGPARIDHAAKGRDRRFPFFRNAL